MLILVHSPKGGVGTTFVAAMLSINLAARGHQVTAIDFTWQDALKLYFGLLPNQGLAEMTAVPGDAMVVAGVEVMNGHAFSREEDFARGIADGSLPLLDKERITIVDVAAGDRDLKDFLLPHADLHLCPLMARPGSLAVLPKVEPGTPTVALEKTLFILNQLDDRRRLSRHTHSFIRELVGDKLLGTLRFDEALNEAVAMFEPIAKFAPSSVLIPDLDRLTTALEARLGLGASAADTQKIAQ